MVCKEIVKASLRQKPCQRDGNIVVETTNEICNDGSPGVFVNIRERSKAEANIKICFNFATYVTLWTRHFLEHGTPTTLSNINCHQRFLNNVLDDVINKYVVDAKYFKSVWTRGHLAPTGDFSSEVDRLMTCYYINVAPQERNFNGVKWSILEESIRDKFKSNDQNRWKIYTGTFQNRVLSIYGALSVPKYFFKVVIADDKGIAFIGVNRNQESLNDDDRNICGNTNTCSLKELGLFTKKEEKKVTQNIICCKISDFIEAVKKENIYLPFTDEENFFELMIFKEKSDNPNENGGENKNNKNTCENNDEDGACTDDKKNNADLNQDANKNKKCFLK